MVASVGSVLLVAFECTVAAATAPVRNGLSGTYFDNAMLLPRDEAALEPCGRVDRLSDLATMNASALPCGGAAVFSARWDGVFAPGFFEDGVSYDLALSANVPVRLWVRTWKLVDVWTNGGQHGSPSADVNLLESPWNFTASSALNYSIRLEMVSGVESPSPAPSPSPLPAPPSVQLLWRRHGAQASFVPVPDIAVLPNVRDSERERQTLQRRLARGWGR